MLTFYFVKVVNVTGHLHGIYVFKKNTGVLSVNIWCVWIVSFEVQHGSTKCPPRANNATWVLAITHRLLM